MNILRNEVLFMKKKYTEEQIQRANDTNLVDFLRGKGQQVSRVGSEYE